MKSKLKEIRDQRFVMTIEENGCIERISPLIDTVNARVETVGAIADVNAQYSETLTEFFDPHIHFREMGRKLEDLDLVMTGKIGGAVTKMIGCKTLVDTVVGILLNASHAPNRYPDLITRGH
ncbi:MAG: hypothetical protein WC765_00655 [Phycisphaerae bacterium]|jgi:hypothetical protein